VGDEGGAGCLALLHAGAQLVRGVDDVLALIGMDVILRDPRPIPAGAVGLLRATGPQTLEALAARLGRPVREVLAELTTLELGGEIIREAGGLVRAR
jgi:predicted Rossmann fold nucleotide-binding protein DprA/Smf involved in DNA uptake